MRGCLVTTRARPRLTCPHHSIQPTTNSIGHDFYVFRDSDANGQVSVVYKRRAEGYGVIRPDAS